MTAVIYARYSSDSQREASIEGQLRDCKDYAEKNGITVVGTYIDRAYSAKTDDRPDFQRMIKDSGRNLRCGSGLEAGPLCPEPIRCRELQIPAGKRTVSIWCLPWNPSRRGLKALWWRVC